MTTWATIFKGYSDVNGKRSEKDIYANRNSEQTKGH